MKGVISPYRVEYVDVKKRNQRAEGVHRRITVYTTLLSARSCTRAILMHLRRLMEMHIIIMILQDFAGLKQYL